MIDLPEHGKPPDETGKPEFLQHRLTAPPPAVANMPAPVGPPPEQPQPEQPTFTPEQVAALAELAKALVDKTPLLDTGLTVADALGLIGSVQIAANIQQVNAPTRQRMINAAYKLQVAIIRLHPNAEDAINMGWQSVR